MHCDTNIIKSLANCKFPPCNIPPPLHPLPVSCYSLPIFCTSFSPLQAVRWNSLMDKTLGKSSPSILHGSNCLNRSRTSYSISRPSLLGSAGSGDLLALMLGKMNIVSELQTPEYLNYENTSKNSGRRGPEPLLPKNHERGHPLLLHQ